MFIGSRLGIFITELQPRPHGDCIRPGVRSLLSKVSMHHRGATLFVLAVVIAFSFRKSLLMKGVIR